MAADYDESKLAKVSVVAGVVIVEDRKVLLVQEAFEKVRGQWNLPAGKVDKDETIEEAAVREAKEESGLDVVLGKHLITVHQSIDRPVLHAFLAIKQDGEVVFDPDEILDARWFSFQEVMTMSGLRNEEYIRGAVMAAEKEV